MCNQQHNIFSSFHHPTPSNFGRISPTLPYPQRLRVVVCRSTRRRQPAPPFRWRMCPLLLRHQAVVIYYCYCLHGIFFMSSLNPFRMHTPRLRCHRLRQHVCVHRCFCHFGYILPVAISQTSVSCVWRAHFSQPAVFFTLFRFIFIFTFLFIYYLFFTPLP